MTKSDPFAKFLSETSTSEDRVVIGGVVFESYERVYKADVDSVNAIFESAVAERVKEAVEEFRKKVGLEIRAKVPRAHTYGSENADVYRAYVAGRDAALRVLEMLPTEPEAK